MHLQVHPTQKPSPHGIAETDVQVMEIISQAKILKISYEIQQQLIFFNLPAALKAVSRFIINDEVIRNHMDYNYLHREG